MLHASRYRLVGTMSSNNNTAFGVHVGNSSACIGVSREGKTDVVANDAGDR